MVGGANWELQLISAVVTPDSPTKRREAYTKAVEGGISAEVLGNPEAHKLWTGVHFFYIRPNAYGNVPSAATLKEQYGSANLPLPAVTEEIEDLISLILERHMRRKVDKAIKQYHHSDQAMCDMTDLFSSLSSIEEVQISSDIVFSEVALADTLKDMYTIKTCGGLTGIPWPWDQMNKGTQGIQDGDLVLLWGLPKSMKTWIGILLTAHILTTGRNVLFYSREMTYVKLRRRISCTLAKVDYTRYLEGNLSNKEENDILKWLIFQRESPTCGELYITTMDKRDGSAGGPEDLRVKVSKYKPHFVLLDSAYMLELHGKSINPYDWRAMAAVMRGIKQVCKSTGIPMVAILQENERAALKYKGKSKGTASLAMNTSAVQDCDLAIRCVYNRPSCQISLYIPAGRETKFEGFTIWAHAADNFRFAGYHMHDVGEQIEEPPAEPEEAQESDNDSTTSVIDEFDEEYGGEESHGTQVSDDTGHAITAAPPG